MYVGYRDKCSLQIFSTIPISEIYLNRLNGLNVKALHTDRPSYFRFYNITMYIGLLAVWNSSVFEIYRLNLFCLKIIYSKSFKLHN